MPNTRFQRLLFVFAATVLCLPWLTPCVGIWSAEGVNNMHNAASGRRDPLRRLPTAQLKAWSRLPGPELKWKSHSIIPSALRVSEQEVSQESGGTALKPPGTLVGKGASLLVDGLTWSLELIDPVTWMFWNTEYVRNGPSKALPMLVISESPFVLLHGETIRVVRDPVTKRILNVRATRAGVTIITPEGKVEATAAHIHYRSPSTRLLLEGSPTVIQHERRLRPEKYDQLLMLDFAKNEVQASGALPDEADYWIRDYRFKRSP